MQLFVLLLQKHNKAVEVAIQRDTQKNIKNIDLDCTPSSNYFRTVIHDFIDKSIKHREWDFTLWLPMVTDDRYVSIPDLDMVDLSNPCSIEVLFQQCYDAIQSFSNQFRDSPFDVHHAEPSLPVGWRHEKQDKRNCAIHAINGCASTPAGRALLTEKMMRKMVIEYATSVQHRGSVVEMLHNLHVGGDFRYDVVSFALRKLGFIFNECEWDKKLFEAARRLNTKFESVIELLQFIETNSKSAGNKLDVSNLSTNVQSILVHSQTPREEDSGSTCDHYWNLRKLSDTIWTILDATKTFTGAAFDSSCLNHFLQQIVR